MTKEEILQVFDQSDYWDVLEAFKQFAEGQLENHYYGDTSDFLKGEASVAKRFLKIYWALEDL